MSGRFLNVLCLNENVGDGLASAPVTHYSQLAHFQVVHIDDYRPEPGDTVIFGGGGMGFYAERFARLLPQISRSISWAIGSNVHGANGYQRQPVLEDFDLCSTRDAFGKGVWVPCPSCKFSFFDDPPAPTTDVVIAWHKDHPLTHPRIKSKRNTGDLNEWLRFLASARKIVTNSYHAIYWAILMEREVVLVSPWSSKFFGMPWTVPIAARSEDALTMPGYKSDDQLTACRKANDDYLQYVLRRLDRL